MDKLIAGLNLWAWAGFICLLMSGYFSYRAARSTTKQVVKSGTEDTLKGTGIQIDAAKADISNPIFRLYNYTLNTYSQIVYEVISSKSRLISLYKANSMTPGNSSFSHLKREEIEELIQKSEYDAIILYNRMKAAEIGLTWLLKDCNNINLSSQYNSFKIFSVNSLNPIGKEIGKNTGNFDFTIAQDDIISAKAHYDEFIQIINRELFNPINKAQ